MTYASCIKLLEEVWLEWSELCSDHFHPNSLGINPSDPQDRSFLK
jgi:hypothetical protein